jgi:Leucine-rich repeat (LRR) protein
MLNDDILFSIAQYLKPKDKHSLFLISNSMSEYLYLNSEWSFGLEPNHDDYLFLLSNDLIGFNRWAKWIQFIHAHIDINNKILLKASYYGDDLDAMLKGNTYAAEWIHKSNDVSIFHWDNLVCLTIFQTRLKTITLCGLPNLDVVDLSNNELISVTITKCPIVACLYLDCNNLKSVEVNHLKTLKHLNISYNNLTDIDIDGLNLVSLTVNGNEMSDEYIKDFKTRHADIEDLCI